MAKGHFFSSKDCYSQKIFLQGKKNWFREKIRNMSITAIQIKELAMVWAEFW